MIKLLPVLLLLALLAIGGFLYFRDARETAPAEPLGGLIEFSLWNESGDWLCRLRFYSTDPHYFPDGQLAGEFSEGVYTGCMPDGRTVVDARYAGGLKLTVYPPDGAPVRTFRTDGIEPSRYENGVECCRIEKASGKVFCWHENGQLAAIVILSQAIFDAWGLDVSVSSAAAHSRLSCETFTRYATPLLREARAREIPGVSGHADAGLKALEESSGSHRIPMQAIFALSMVEPEPGDMAASLLCQILMSADESIRADAERFLDRIDAGAVPAAWSLALMANEQAEVPAVHDWALAALQRMGPPAIVALGRRMQEEPRLRAAVEPVVEWLSAQPGK